MLKDFLKKLTKKNSFRFFLLCFLSLSAIFFLSEERAYSGQVTLSWNPPTTNADGTPLTDLNGYYVYYGTTSGTTSGSYAQVTDVRNVTTYTPPDNDNLSNGIYYFAVKAYDTSRNESVYSNEVSKTIFRLSITRGGTGTGTVTSSPAGISCDSDCSEAYTANTVVTLTASPNASSTFTGWSGVCTGTGTCTVTMDAAKTVTATFTFKTYTITASAGTGGTISPASRTVNNGSTTTFTVTPNTGYTATMGGTCGGSLSGSTYTTNAITADCTVSASFAANTYSLTVTKAGTGTGTISSTPAGINCGSDCAEAYNSGTSVTLTASPDASATFAGWSGACTGAVSCTVTMDAAKSVTATFTLKTYTITASAGSGGSISPSGSVTVNYGANQTFTIYANTGYSIKDVLVDGTSVGAVSTYTFTNVVGDYVISVSFGMADYDKDGVPDLEEFGPNSDNSNYDGNGDGIADYLQNNVVSLYTYNRNGYITMYTLDGHALKNVITISVPTGAPQGLDFPYQFIEFMIEDIAQGSSAAVVIKLPAGTTMDQYYKYGPTPDNPSPHWYDFTFDGQTGAEISGNLVTLYIIDGLKGDDDLTANGQIFDQGGPARIDANGLPKTGQTMTYAPGDDGYIQAGIEWPNPRFTNNGDGTVTDSLTGLMWLRDGGCLRNSWSNSLNAIKDINNKLRDYSCLDYKANYSDWRLPNVKELESLINYGASNSSTWLNSVGFAKMKSSYYWSSTTDQGNTSKTWLVMMSDGREMSGYKSSRYYTMAVRTNTSGNSNGVPKTGQTASYAIGDDGDIQAGIEWSNPRFTNNGDGTVMDNLTGLMWLRDGGCIKKSWSNAFNAITDFNSNPGDYSCLDYKANYSDWRLPNVKELESLINYGASNSSTWLNSEGFVDVKPSYYWSSTTYQGNASQAQMVEMTTGKMVPAIKTSTYYVYYVWPVRVGNVSENQSAQILAVIKAGTGTGTVTSSPAGINCGSDCLEAYNTGTVVTLSASPAAGSTFASWSGGGCTGTGTCTVTMNAAKAVTATFSIKTYTITYNLSLSKAGTGTGTVTSSPAGINCGSDCLEAYNAGTVVTLSASPATGSTFAGWSGGGCTGTGTCTVTMNAAKAVSATFNYIKSK